MTRGQRGTGERLSRGGDVAGRGRSASPLSGAPDAQHAAGEALPTDATAVSPPGSPTPAPCRCCSGDPAYCVMTPVGCEPRDMTPLTDADYGEGLDIE